MHFLHEWRGRMRDVHINVKECVAGFSALSSFFDARPASFARERGDNTTEQATAAQNKTRSALVAEVLRARGDCEN